MKNLLVILLLCLYALGELGVSIPFRPGQPLRPSARKETV
jgi:hypothetical protein